MAKKAQKKTETSNKIEFNIAVEDWKGNQEEVVTLSQNGKEVTKFSLSAFQTAYGEFKLRGN